MFRYLLDANAVIPFQRAGCLNALVAAAKSVPMAIVDDVLEELTVPRKPTDPETNLMKEANRELRGSSIELIEVLAGSKEDATRGARMAFVDRGEAASIAVASRRLDLVFVTEDVRAVQGKPKLYRELPGDVGRIMGLHAFLRLLVEHGPLSATLASAVAASRDLDPPLWWMDWAASFPPH
jgi:predicted nucleic acid-binding protein